MKKILFAGLAAIALISSCKSDKAPGITIISPEAGTSVRSGTELLIDVDFADTAIDSITYLIDSTVIARKKDTSDVKFPTNALAMGNHLVTAKVYHSGAPEEFTSNIVVLASTEPQQYTFEVVNTYPHDTTSYVEGLEYHDGLLYESDGQYIDRGGSSLRIVNLETGKVLKQVSLDSKYFAEGITVVGNKIIQLTYREGLGFVYDKTSLKKLSEFQYQAGREGWGLTFDGTHLLNTSDGTNAIHFLNKDTYLKEATLNVFDNNGPVNMLNELEFIDGKVYANVYTSTKIVIINPQTGVVEGQVDLASLMPKAHVGDDDYALNGIAWDKAGKRLFVTGKWWDKLYEIRLKPLNSTRLAFRR